MKNNQGVTLIELITVILIIGILAGTAMVGLHSIDSGNVKSSVDRVSALLNYVRVENMSMDAPYYLVIRKVNSSFLAEVQYEKDGNRTTVLSEKLKLKNGDITYYARKGAVEKAYTINDSVSSPVTLEISYHKGAGDFSFEAVDEIKSIVITASSRTYTIYLVMATGKHYIE